MTPSTVPEPTSNGVVPPDKVEITLLEIVNVLRWHRRLLVMLPLVLAVLLAGLAMSQNRSYRTTASFMAQEPDRSGTAAALARQFGISVGGSERSGQSLQFYADLLRSREVLRQVVESEYRVPAEGRTRSVTLDEYREFNRLKQETWNELLHPTTLVRWKA